MFTFDEAPGGPLQRVVTAYTPRLAEFAFEPGFVAAVDQHAAELRDRFPELPRQRTAAEAPDTAFGVQRPDREALSDYVLGFTDALTEIGWCEPVGHDYAVVRLTALCLLVREYGLLVDGTGAAGS